MLKLFYKLLILLLSISWVFALDIQEIKTANEHILAVNIALNKDNLSLYWKNANTQSAFQTISNLDRYLKSQNQKLLFATNSGIYDTSYRPLGLHVENGQTLVTLNKVKPVNTVGNFSLLPNGVFAIYKEPVDSDNLRAAIFDSDEYEQRFAKNPPLYASQSGPMLIKDGNLHARFLKDSDSLKIRNAVCLSDVNRLYFLISIKSSNFFNFSTVLKEQLNCQNALYLDGSLAQIYVDGRFYGASIWEIRPYVGIWAVTTAIEANVQP